MNTAPLFAAFMTSAVMHKHLKSELVPPDHVNPKLSAGISEALIATAFGLMVAIPAVWSFNYFQTKIDNLTAEMTYVSKEFIDYLIKGVSGEFGRSRFTREFNTSPSGSNPISQ